MCGSSLHSSSEQTGVKPVLEYIRRQNDRVLTENKTLREILPKPSVRRMLSIRRAPAPNPIDSPPTSPTLPVQYTYWKCAYKHGDRRASGAECEAAVEAQTRWNAMVADLDEAVAENNKLREENLNLRTTLDDLWHRGRLRSVRRPAILSQNPPWPNKLRNEYQLILGGDKSI
ncbi:hypothetical protein NA57DRAFT_51247 [Rhizodiscina lignyota]|uniref:Uncharacterized protein n=1 Tax=Rhizodiscina lignyota TaxID=1504668 RepID=A0A9P4IMT7_9PEZI|nr:hypothetical protein NA57DRAFT_51247 [Rhizodiscina lignyota]